MKKVGVMNGIVSGDEEYQQISRKSDEYSDRLDELDLSKEIRLLVDRFVSEQNALDSRYGMLAYLFGFSDCKTLSPDCLIYPVRMLQAA